MSTETLIERLRRIGPIFRSKDAIEAGVSWRDLYALRDAGTILSLSRGLYRLNEGASTDAIDFVTVCARAPKGMICLNSALSHWDLSDEIPRSVHLAVPKGTHRPTIDHPPTNVHVFAADTFDIGCDTVSGESRQDYRITGRERTVVDAFRLRHRVGDDLAIEAIRRYAGLGGRLADVLIMGRRLRAGSALAETLRLFSA